MVDATQIGNLLGGLYNPDNRGAYGAVLGQNQDVTTSVLGGLSSGGSQPVLSTTQSSAIENIRKFVADNVQGQAADKLFKSIDALEDFLKTNKVTEELDPVFSLLSSNPEIINSGIIQQQQSGDFIDIVV